MRLWIKLSLQNMEDRMSPSLFRSILFLDCLGDMLPLTKEMDKGQSEAVAICG